MIIKSLLICEFLLSPCVIISEEGKRQETWDTVVNGSKSMPHCSHLNWKCKNFRHLAFHRQLWFWGRGCINKSYFKRHSSILALKSPFEQPVLFVGSYWSYLDPFIQLCFKKAIGVLGLSLCQGTTEHFSWEEGLEIIWRSLSSSESPFYLLPRVPQHCTACLLPPAW